MCDERHAFPIKKTVQGGNITSESSWLDTEAYSRQETMFRFHKMLNAIMAEPGSKQQQMLNMEHGTRQERAHKSVQYSRQYQSLRKSYLQAA